MENAQKLLTMTVGGTQFNTSLIERFNGTLRERLASLTRKCRHAVHRLDVLETGMYLIGCTYNFCFPHHELSDDSPRLQAGGFWNDSACSSTGLQTFI